MVVSIDMFKGVFLGENRDPVHSYPVSVYSQSFQPKSEMFDQQLVINYRTLKETIN